MRRFKFCYFLFTLKAAAGVRDLLKVYSQHTIITVISIPIHPSTLHTPIIERNYYIIIIIIIINNFLKKGERNIQISQ